MGRKVRYQAAVMRGTHILLVKQGESSVYEYWNVPGGGREEGESEEQCVVREVREETSLDIKVERLLIDGPSHRHSPYQQFKTYLCTAVAGEVKPDSIECIDVGWFDLTVEFQWQTAVSNNETSYVMLERIRRALGLQ